MKSASIHTRALALLASAFLFAQFAQAQATRTWVSGIGDDANPCSRTASCRTFAGAISKTAAGGEISVLDSGSYGVVTITKSITLSGDGNLAGILNAGTNGIIINAGANDVVQLRNLSITGAGTGLNGIRVLNAGLVVIDRLTIADQTNSGIDVSTTQATPLNVIVRDVVVTNILDANATAGIKVAHGSSTASPGPISVQLDNVRIQGVDFVGASPPTALPAGVLIGLGTSAQLDRVTVNRAGIGVSATAANSVVYLSDSTVTQNATGLATSGGGRIISYNNNRLRGNTSDGVPTSTVYLR